MEAGSRSLLLLHHESQSSLAQNILESRNPADAWGTYFGWNLQSVRRRAELRHCTRATGRRRLPPQNLPSEPKTRGDLTAPLAVPSSKSWISK
eukprot:scaffold49418_cov19-Tisochrysis_lutea.AAC.1